MSQRLSSNAGDMHSRELRAQVVQVVRGRTGIQLSQAGSLDQLIRQAVKAGVIFDLVERRP